MKDQFIATVSHELRTPLTSINGSLGLLAGGAAGSLPEKAGALVENALRNVKRLTLLITDLLDMEKLVAGKMPMTMVEQALTPLIEEAVESLAGYASQHNVRIQTRFNLAAVPVQVNVDGPRLIQAFTNLLSNAIKFSPEGETVEISTELDADRVLILVRDRGPGVDPAFRSQLFQRFSQADGSDTRKLPGTGLGLAITREISQQLGGEVDYRDAPGGGGEFYIQLSRVENQN
jgi:signal transduction histidine kinase